MIVADPPETAIYVLLGDNSGRFTVRSRLVDDNYPTAIYTADLNGDGHVDFVAPAETGGATLVYLGRGDGTFSTPVAYNPSPGAHDILADVNGDGHPDLVSLSTMASCRSGSATPTVLSAPFSSWAPPHRLRTARCSPFSMWRTTTAMATPIWPTLTPRAWGCCLPPVP